MTKELVAMQGEWRRKETEGEGDGECNGAVRHSYLLHAWLGRAHSTRHVPERK
jgi:hypothetical protein